MSRSVHDSLEAASDAMRRHAWEEARQLLVEADAEGALDAEGLRQLGKALNWCGDVAGELDAFERSYAAFVAAGERRKAAHVALMIRGSGPSACWMASRNAQNLASCGGPRGAERSSMAIRMRAACCCRKRSSLETVSATRI
jgi:hypothetical protein